MPSIKVPGENAEQQLREDLAPLNGFNEQQLSQFIDVVLNFLVNRSDLQADVAAFAQANGVANMAALRSTLRGVLQFFKLALRQSISPQNLRDDLVHFGMGEPRANVVAGKWKVAYVDLSRSLIGQTLLVNELLDIDWRFGVTSGSSEMNQVGTTFLQLRLVISKGNKIENVHMELTLAQFYEFLSEMEKAKQAMDMLTP